MKYWGKVNTFRLVPALWREVEDQERKRVAVEGVAGSGKTMLAMIRARRFADEGKSVLFVCFNALLADRLRTKLPAKFRQRITVRHYHGLCAEWAKRARVNWPTGGNDPVLWNDVTK